MDRSNWDAYLKTMNPEVHNNPLLPMKKQARKQLNGQKNDENKVKKNTEKKADTKKNVSQTQVVVKPAVPVNTLDADRWAKLLGPTWFEELKETLASSYMQSHLAHIDQERQTKMIFPPEELVYNAFHKTPLDRVRVVILDQSPYSQLGQAMGLAFSMPSGHKVPPTITNMYNELECTPTHGDLSHWAAQGVFLLTTSLTTELGRNNAHDGGWAQFTQTVIELINSKCDHVVFLVWGNALQKKMKKINIDRKKHVLLEGPHPAPLSSKVPNPFKGCDHFNVTNAKLKEWGLPEINWIPA
eukprot:GEMP01042088.1.p1 GENE.GEMP01042088.1~~GEMP01042088.1.p1  ORF type:complete len:317 (+),score=68.77 GEMP01042088.1:56-952(+)